MFYRNTRNVVVIFLPDYSYINDFGGIYESEFRYSAAGRRQRPYALQCVR